MCFCLFFVRTFICITVSSGQKTGGDNSISSAPHNCQQNVKTPKAINLVGFTRHQHLRDLFNCILYPTVSDSQTEPLHGNSCGRLYTAKNESNKIELK